MSYDYWLVRLNRRVTALKDLQEEDTLPLNADTVRPVLDEHLAGATWTDGTTLNASSLGYGRLDVYLRAEPLAMVRVRGSYNAEQIALLRRIAAALDSHLFDIQTGETWCEQAFPP